MSFRYGQRHSIELTKAEAFARARNVAKHIIVDFDLRMIGGSALTDDIDVPKHQSAADLEGGILEGLGRLFKKNVRLYAYPRRASDGAIITADNFRVEPKLRHLYSYLRENDFVVPVTDYREEILSIKSPEVLAMIRAGDPVIPESDLT